MNTGPLELLSASDETIDDAVTYADPLELRGLLYQLTGDQDVLDIALTTMVVGGFREMYFVAEESDVARIRAKAAAFLRSYRDSGPVDLPPTFIDVASAEVFRDEDVAYTSKIWADGGVCELHVWPGGFHAFDKAAPTARLSIAMIETRTAWLKRTLGY